MTNMQQVDISNGVLSTPITRSLGLTADAPRSVVINRKIYEYPNQRKKELEDLNADLERKYKEAESSALAAIEQSQNKLKQLKSSLSSTKAGTEDSINSVNGEIQSYTTDIDVYTTQIKKDVSAIRWMNTWRVVWGLLCTAGIVFVGAFIVVAAIAGAIIGSAGSDSKRRR